MRIHIRRTGPHSELDTEVDVTREVWATRSPLKVAEFITRELANRYGAAKGWGYDDPRTLNYYAGMLDHVLPIVRELMIKEYQDLIRKVREIKGAG